VLRIEVLAWFAIAALAALHHAVLEDLLPAAIDWDLLGAVAAAVVNLLVGAALAAVPVAPLNVLVVVVVIAGTAVLKVLAVG